MRQMTGITVFIPDRGMDNPLLEFCHHVGMTIHARFPGLLRKSFLPAGKQQQQTRNNNGQSTCF